MCQILWRSVLAPCPTLFVLFSILHSVLLSLSWLSLVTYIPFHCWHYNSLSSYFFVALLCSWSQKTLSLLKWFIMKDSLHFAYDIENLINARQLPLWQFSNLLVQNFTTYNLVLLQSFGKMDFFHSSFFGVIVYWIECIWGGSLLFW